MKRIVVTGGSGKAGRACVDDLLAHGYEVFVVDQTTPSPRKCESILCDLTDYGQTIDAISSAGGGGNINSGDRAHGVHAIVHLAAIPAPRIYANA
ncbi:MAG: NAD-dependent epimerase/dehydratase family protein, partial [Anaerolineae bacterium]|nr:NAD-dependent epimerase/dehydratase family protein [Phycisphaerae bacterium]